MNVWFGLVWFGSAVYFLDVEMLKPEGVVLVFVLGRRGELEGN